MWRTDGLKEPAEVKQAVAEYRERQDILHDYLTESCLVKPSETVVCVEFYRKYKSWCDDNDAHCIGKNTFNARMREKGFQSDRGTDHKLIWRGIRLLTEDEKITLSTLSTQNTVTSSRARAKRSSPKKGNESTLSTFPETPCIQCGSDEPVIEENTGAYKCSQCSRYYPQPVGAEAVK